jgi:large subunit ribosomal protein L18
MGTADRPRLCFHKSLRHIYAQLIDDDGDRTLASVTTNRKDLKNGNAKSFRNSAMAKQMGTEIAAKAKEAGIERVVFDRGGYLYHGLVKQFAEAAREAGLKF